MYGETMERTLPNAREDAARAATRAVDAEALALARAGSRFVVANLVAAAVALVVAWPALPAWLTLPWLFFVGATGAVHLAVGAHLARPSGDAHSPWVRFHGAMTVLFALAWGFGAALAMPRLPAPAAPVLALGVLVTAWLAQPLVCLRPAIAGACVAAAALPPAAMLAAQAHAAIAATALLLAVLSASVAWLQATRHATVRRAAEALGDTAEQLQRLHEDRRRMAAQLRAIRDGARAAHERSTATLDAVGEGVIRVTGAGAVEYLNPAAEALTGWRLHEVRGRPLGAVLRTAEPDTRAGIADLAGRCLAANGDGGDVLVLRRDGREQTVAVRAAALADGAVLVLREVTAERALAAELEWYASHEPLTGLATRSVLVQRLEHLTRSDDGPHALLVIALDRMRVANALAGPAAGDRLLRRVSALLAARARAADTAARVGGDELALLMHGCAPEKARMIAEDLRRAIAACELPTEDGTLRVTASIGIAGIGSHVTGAAAVLAAAESAWRTAKAAGGDRVRLWQGDDAALAAEHEERRWLPRLQAALAAERLELCQRPVAPLASRLAARGCRLRARLVEPGQPAVPPAALDVAAERCRMRAALDRSVLKATLDALRLGHPALRRMEIVMLELAPATLADEALPEWIAPLLEELGPVRRRLCFVIGGPGNAVTPPVRRFVAAVKSHGCRVALADAGAGMQAIAELEGLRPDYLEVPEAIAARVTASTAALEATLALARLAATLGAGTIARGVASTAAATALAAAGIDLADGPLAGGELPLQTAR